MRNIQHIDCSSITVQVWATHRHNWMAGQKLHHDPAEHRDAAQVFQLWLVQQGCVEFHTAEQKWRIDKGEACLIPVSLEREIVTPQPTSWLSLRLRITVFNKFDLMENAQLPAQWRPDAAERVQMESWMKQIDREFRLEDAHHHLTVSGLAHALLGMCWPHVSSVSLAASMHSELPAWLAQTMQRILADPSCTVADLAHEAGFSPAQFRRAFRQHVGSTPRDYLKLKRLEAARHFLEHTSLSFGVIAVRVGLHDATYFARIFKDFYGISPALFRASLMPVQD